MKSLRFVTILGLMIIILVTTTGLSPLAPYTPLGATIDVDIFTDEYSDSDTGCSLREAIQSANTDADFGGCVGTGEYGADTILLPAGRYLLTRSGSNEGGNVTGDLNLKSELELIGTGLVIIDAGGDTGILDRVIESHNPGITLTNLTITGGRAPDGNGGGADGGGIFNVGTLTLVNVTVSGNRAGDGNPGGGGGGIVNYTTLIIENSIISGNQAGNGLNTGIDGVRGGYGGGIYCNSGSLSILNSSITNNIAGAGEADKPYGYGGAGGGIYFSGTSANITGSTISGNIAGSSSDFVGGSGGGIYAASDLILINSTVSGNTSGSSTYEYGSPGNGGGITAYSPVIIRYSTIYDNHIGTASGDGMGGGIYSAGGTFTLGASILAGNTDQGGNGPDCYSTASVNSEDYNLIGNTTGCPLSLSTVNSILNPVGFSLPPLGNFGGLTQTHPLPAGNLAVDWIPIGNAGCGTTFTDDQRGYARPVNSNGAGTAACDIGAYELQWLYYMPMIKK
jgi:CSLREA domain-containing protein